MKTSYGLSGISPLSRAIQKQSLDIVTFLIENGANMNILGRDGYSPYQKAVRAAATNVKIIRYLLRNGADLKSKTIDGETSLEVALRTKKSISKVLVLHMQ